MRNDFSVGGVVLDDRGRVALIRTTDASGAAVWGFPKGHPKRSETPVETAKREVREETGLEVELDADHPLRTITYFFEGGDGQRVHKRVDFYLMRSTGGDISDHDHEVEEVVLLAPEEARERLTYENEQVLLDDLFHD